MDNNECIIYIYYNSEDVILYIGKSNNFSTRQKEHLLRGEEYMFYFDYVEKYSFDSELYRDIYELFLINKEKPYYNEQGVVKTSKEEIEQLEKFLPQGKLIERIYRYDCDFLIKRNVALFDLEFSVLADLANYMIQNYPEVASWSKEKVYNFFFNTEEGWNLYLDNFYLRIRKKWYTEAQYKNNLNRFRQNHSFIKLIEEDNNG